MSETTITFRLSDRKNYVPKHEKIRIARELSQKTQRCVAIELGISQQAYRKLESGDTVITQQRFEKIAQIIGIDTRIILIIDKIPLKFGTSEEALADINTFLLAFGDERKRYEEREQKLVEEVDFWKQKFMDTLAELHQ